MQYFDYHTIEYVHCVASLAVAFLPAASSAVYAMQMLQNEMRGEAKKADLDSDEDIMAMVKEMRQEDEQKWEF